jgi:4-hydroxythreonine-4-phosphate dehydrogenase
MSIRLPFIAIAMGDAAGVGPEIIVKTLADDRWYARCRPLVIGDPDTLASAVRLAGAAVASGVQVRDCADLNQAGRRPGVIDVWHPADLQMPPFELAQLSPALGRVAADCQREAMRLAQQGAIQGLVTAPMNKEGFHRAGFDYPDELAYMTALSGAGRTTTMGVMRGLWVDTVAEHVPFRDIADLITRESVLWHIQQLAEVLGRVRGAGASMAVAALNVHGGEGGAIGREEIDEIAPAIAEAREQGIDAVGPIPADSVFVRALAGEFAGVLAMYHDQANIARKLQPMAERATLFVGLRIPVGTTAHGTAYDIAGRGIADPGSLRCALAQVIDLTTDEHR